MSRYWSLNHYRTDKLLFMWPVAHKVTCGCISTWIVYMYPFFLHVAAEQHARRKVKAGQRTDQPSCSTLPPLVEPHAGHHGRQAGPPHSGHKQRLLADLTHKNEKWDVLVCKVYHTGKHRNIQRYRYSCSLHFYQTTFNGGHICVSL